MSATKRESRKADLSDYGRRCARRRLRLGLQRPAGPFPSRRAYVAEALADIAAHAAERGLRPHQSEAVGSVARHVRDPSKPPVALVTIPTAGGKTRAFQTIVSALGTVDEEGRSRVPNTLVLVPTRVLIRQTYIEFRRHFPQVDVLAVSSVRLVDDEGARIPTGVGPTTLMTYKGFVEAAAAGEIRPEDIDLLVMDEAHRGLSDLRRQVLRPFLDGCVVTAWTATPAFDDQKSVQNLLGPENEVYRISPQELRDRGVIAPMINYVMSVNVDGDETEVAPSGLLAAKRTALVDGVVDFIATHVDADTGLDLAGKIAIFYGADRAHAAEFAAAYNRRFGGRLRMEVLTGLDSSDHIRRTLDGVRRGEITAIGNAALLGEGFDFPQIGLVINSPTESVVRVLQQAGRMQRFDPSLPYADPRQTSFVLDTFYKVNGRIEGRPRFVFEALDDPGSARIVDTNSLPISRAPPRRNATPAGTVRYTVSSEITAVVRMLAERDSVYGPTGPEWLRLVDIQALAPMSKRPVLAGAWFDLQVGRPMLSDGPVRFELRRPPSRNRPAYRLHIDELDRFYASCGISVVDWRRRGIVPAFPEDDQVGRLMAAKTIGTDPGSEAFGSFIDEAEEAAFAALRAVPPGPAPRLRVEVRGAEFEMQFVQRSRGQATWAFRAADLPRIASLIGALAPPRSEGDGWLVLNEIAPRPRRSAEGAAFFDALEDAFRARIRGTGSAEATMPARGRDLRMAMRRIANWAHVCYRIEDVPAVRAMAGLNAQRPPKTPDMLNRQEVGALTGGRSPVTEAVFRSVEAEYDAMERGEIPAGPIVRDGMVLDVVGCRSGSFPMVCYRESDLPKLLKLFGRASPIPDGWMTRRDCKAAAKGAGRTPDAFRFTWREFGEAVKAGEAPTFEGRTIRAGLYNGAKMAGTMVCCIHPDDFAVFLDMMDFRHFRPQSRYWVDAVRAVAEAAGRPPDAVRAAVEAVRTREGVPALARYRKRFKIREADVKAMAAVVAAHLDARPAPPEQPKDRLAPYRAAQALHVGPGEEWFRAFWRDLAAATREGRPLRVTGGEVVGMFVRNGTRGGRPTISVAAADLPLIAAHFGRRFESVPDWSEDYLNRVEVSRRLNDRFTSRFAAAWKAMIDRDGHGGLRAGRMRKHSIVTHFLHRDDVAEFDRRFGGGLLAATEPVVGPPRGTGDFSKDSIGSTTVS